MKKIRENAFIILFAYFALFLTLNSTWGVRALNVSESLAKVFTLMVYIPFALAVGYKILTDKKNIKRTFSSVSNWIYYIFLLYYVGLCVFRLIAKMEVKENLYFSIIFFGSIAVYMLLRDGRIFMTRKHLERNLLWIAVLFVLYRLAYVLIGAQIFSKPPININLTSGAVALLLPFVGNMMTEPGQEKKKAILPWIVFCGGLVVVATTGARAIFLLVAANLLIMLVVAIIRRKGVLRLVSSLALACAIVAVLAVADVGQVRYSLYRQTGIDFESVRSSFEATTVPTEAPQARSVQPVQEQTQSQEQILAQKQTDKSDWMRKLLVQHGIEVIQENPWFGTGDVLYGFRITKTYKTMQSAHNFLIEAIVCYGIIGLTMIAALVVTLLIEAKLFTKLALRRWNYKVTLLLTMVFYFGLGFVQPTVFDAIICPLFVLTVAACRKALHEA